MPPNLCIPRAIGHADYLHKTGGMLAIALLRSGQRNVKKM